VKPSVVNRTVGRFVLRGSIRARNLKLLLEAQQLLQSWVHSFFNRTRCLPPTFPALPEFTLTDIPEVSMTIQPPRSPRTWGHHQDKRPKNRVLYSSQVGSVF